MQVYKCTVEKDAQMNRTAQRTREIVLTRFTVYLRVCGQEKTTKLVAHMLKNTLNSICLQIQADYVTFLFEKTFVLKECKEHSIVCMSALMIINKIVLVVH